MADESPLPIDQAEDVTVDDTDPGDCFGGLPDLITNLGLANNQLDIMAQKLTDLQPKLDSLLAALARADQAGSGGDTGSGATPGSEGG